MKIRNTNSWSLAQLHGMSIEILICSAGYEERATYFSSKFREKLEEIPIKVCIGFNDNRVLSRDKNDIFFKSHNFNMVNGDGDTADKIDQIFNPIIAYKNTTEINIVVDYSCMTRVWYAEILHYINVSEIDTKVNVFFVYSYSKFSPAPLDVSNNIHVGPIKGFSSLSIPYKPTALVIGLGYEKNRAFGLTEYLDAETFVFYNDDGKGKEFGKEIEIANSELLSKIEPKNIFRYPINDLKFTEFLLTSLCKDLKDKYRIILAPCGPKPFTLVCLIVSLKFKIDFIDVWRISPGVYAEPVDKIPEGDFGIYKVEFEK